MAFLPISQSLRSFSFLRQITIAASFRASSPISFLSSRPTQISPWCEAREDVDGMVRVVVAEVAEGGARVARAPPPVRRRRSGRQMPPRGSGSLVPLATHT